MTVTNEVATPCLLVDAAVVKRNLQRLADYTKANGIGLRPHTKTHKSVKLARMQLELGAVGLAVAKPGEAAVMVEAGDDVLVAYPVVSPQGCEVLAELAQQKTVRVDVDSMVGVQHLSEAAKRKGSTLGVLVEFDVGLKRTGVQTASQTLELARAIDQAAGLRLDGLMIYPGHVRTSPEQQNKELEAVTDLVAEALELWRGDGLEAKIVSGGSTPTAYQSHQVKGVTEIRPGTYVYNDMNTVARGYCTIDDCAARVLTTVVSDAVPGQVVIDAGSKMLSSDGCMGDKNLGFGHVVEYPQARIAWMNEEHGVLDMSKCDAVPKVGDRVTVIPNHVCPCVNLQDAFWWVEDGEVQRCCVDARGKVA